MPRIDTFGRARNGRCELGLAHAQPDDGELRRRERDQHAEGVEAREERRIATGSDLGEHDEPDRKSGCDHDRLARDERPPFEARELARQRAVLGQRVRRGA